MGRAAPAPARPDPQQLLIAGWRLRRTALPAPTATGGQVPTASVMANARATAGVVGVGGEVRVEVTGLSVAIGQNGVLGRMVATCRKRAPGKAAMRAPTRLSRVAHS